MILLDEDLKKFDIYLDDEAYKNNKPDAKLFKFLEQKRDERSNTLKKNDLEGMKTIKKQHD